jgi:hypothetical protein
MISIQIDKLKRKQAQSLIQFLESNLDESVHMRGDQIQVDAENHRNVKRTVHKFLHHEGLDDYRVISDGNVLEILMPAKPSQKILKLAGGGASGFSPYSPYRVEPWTTVEFPNYPPAPSRKFKQTKKTLRA